MRLTDIDGGLINTPEGYKQALQGVCTLIASMEDQGIDRADMVVVLSQLNAEIDFNFLMLPNRKVSDEK